MRSNHNINVSWQGTLFILAMLVSAGAAAVRVQNPGRQLNESFDDVLLVAVPLGILAFVAGLYAAGNRNRKAEVLLRAAVGIGLLVAAAIITALSYNFGSFSAFGGTFFLAPTGLFLAGLVAIVRALSPNQRALRGDPTKFR